MRDARNIHEVSQLGIDWIGLDFIPNSERYVSQIASCAGIIPDYSSLSDLSSDKLSQQKEVLFFVESLLMTCHRILLHVLLTSILILSNLMEKKVW